MVYPSFDSSSLRGYSTLCQCWQGKCRGYFCNKEESREALAIIKKSKLMEEIEAFVDHLVVNFMCVFAECNAGKRITFTQWGLPCFQEGITSLDYNTHEVIPENYLIQDPNGSTSGTNTQDVDQTGNVALWTKRLSLKILRPSSENASFFAASLQINIEKLDRSAVQTVTQRESRLTSSNFGVVCRWKDTTSCNLLKRLLINGIHNEYIDIKRFEAETGVAYLWIWNVVIWGARSDGLVGEGNVLVEVKFVTSAKPLVLMETARQKKKKKKKKNLFLEMTSDNILKRKKTHHYFYQVQGALNITGCQFCYFLVMTDKHESLHTEKLSADETFWRQEITSKH
ncbi:hypothetical protein PR048_008886 [Dryococelus australis]|uniref:Decapping nuclease n=1 Tax=Dryococelus australis TaxID=614101 RepID=A0ABQ9HYQ7_9NEOP|nr:hypothetical protein PR048_008886 [Dryococelus australis]